MFADLSKCVKFPVSPCMSQARLIKNTYTNIYLIGVGAVRVCVEGVEGGGGREGIGPIHNNFKVTGQHIAYLCLTLIIYPNPLKDYRVLLSPQSASRACTSK